MYCVPRGGQHRSVCGGCGREHFCFFFQAEDGIRVTSVTGVQTCALPILLNTHEPDVVVATETWLKPSIFDAELEADNYTI